MCPARQGGAVATLLVARIEQLELRQPRFVIVCAGFRSPLPTNPSLRWSRAERLGAAGGRLTTPALIMVGQHDTVTPEPQACMLAALFDDAEVRVMPGGGHAMPQRPADLEAIAAFVRKFEPPPPAL